MDESRLRPIERRILTLVEDGVPVAEIARRFHRSPTYVERVIALASLPVRHAHDNLDGHELRPIERCVLGWRTRGASPAEIAPHFRRSERFIAQVEELARYKLSR